MSQLTVKIVGPSLIITSKSAFTVSKAQNNPLATICDTCGHEERMISADELWCPCVGTKKSSIQATAEINLLKKMIARSETYLKRRIGNNGECSSTRTTCKQIERWESELAVQVAAEPELTAINREPTNDVDYLTSARSECNSTSPTSFTPADMQLIFIKNLSTTLIQRMHSLDHFSEDDYAVGGNDLKAWDLVVDCDGFFGFAVCDLIHHESGLLNRVRILRLKKFQDTTFTHNAIINGWRMDDIDWHTITEAQLPAFRSALEACYAQ